MPCEPDPWSIYGSLLALSGPLRPLSVVQIRFLPRPIRFAIRGPIQIPIRFPIRRPIRFPICGPIQFPIRGPIQIPIRGPILSLFRKEL